MIMIDDHSEKLMEARIKIELDHIQKDQVIEAEVMIIT